MDATGPSHPLKPLHDLKDAAYTRSLADVRRRCQAELDGLPASDPRLHGGVRLIHRDNSILHFQCAFSRVEGDWVFIFTANHGALAYLKDELVACHDDGEPAEASAAKLRHPDGGGHADGGGRPALGAEGDSSVGFGDMPISTSRLA